MVPLTLLCTTGTEANRERKHELGDDYSGKHTGGDAYGSRHTGGHDHGSQHTGGVASHVPGEDALLVIDGPWQMLIEATLSSQQMSIEAAHLHLIEVVTYHTLNTNVCRSRLMVACSCLNRHGGQP